MWHSLTHPPQKKSRESNPEKANFIVQKWYDTVVLTKKKNGQNLLAHSDQIRIRIDEDVDLEEK